MLSKKEVQHLRYLNAAAIDCMDRIAAERDKRNDVCSHVAEKSVNKEAFCLAHAPYISAHTRYFCMHWSTCGAPRCQSYFSFAENVAQRRVGPSTCPRHCAPCVFQEMNDAVLSLRRMRTEKQQLVERLEGFEHEHSQLRMQQEQHLCDQEKLHQLQAALSSGQVERERIEALLHGEYSPFVPVFTMPQQAFVCLIVLTSICSFLCLLLPDKEENLLCVTREKDALIDKLTSQVRNSLCDNAQFMLRAF